MRYIKKQPEPKSFTDAKKKVDKNVGDPWLYDKNITNEKIRKDLREQLSKEQNNCCAYCETHINWKDNNTCDIDHYRKRDIFNSSEYILDYNNLFLCCKAVGRKYCAGYKDEHIMDILGCKIKNKKNIEEVKNVYRFILNPTDKNDKPEKYFYYNLYDRTIAIKDNLSDYEKEKAKLTIELFQLNCKDLINSRRKAIEYANNMKKRGNLENIEDLEFIVNQVGFYSFLKEFIES